jgi:hypothetical protein
MLDNNISSTSKVAMKARLSIAAVSKPIEDIRLRADFFSNNLCGQFNNTDRHASHNAQLSIPFQVDTPPKPFKPAPSILLVPF